MSLVSRAELLRLLQSRPEAEHPRLAARLGFDHRPTPEAETGTAVATGTATLSLTIDEAPALSTAPKDYHYWTVMECRAIEKAGSREEEDPLQPGEPIDDTEPQSITPLPRQPLLNAGEWLNCWDRALPQQHSSHAIDLPRTVRRLARGEPIRRLPRKQRKNRNHASVLILDAGPELRPVWQDLHDACISLSQLLGREQLEIFRLAAGPDGDWQRPGETELGSEGSIPEGARLVMIGAFGALRHGRLGKDWRRLIRRLLGADRQVVLMPVCPLNRPPVPTLPLDSRSSRNLQNLLTALALTWLPSVDQLRRLRLAIPGAGLLDELLAYNHPEVERAGPWLALRREGLIERLRGLDKLDQSIQSALRRTVEEWQKSLAPTAREIERLQAQLHKRPQPQGFPRLQRLATITRQELQDPTGIGTAYRLMVSLLPVAELLADSQVKPQWRELLQAAQQVALDARQTLPLQHHGLHSTGQSRWLRQLDDELVLDDTASGADLLALGTQPYCVQTRRPLDQRTRPLGDTLEIIDQGRRYRLRALRRPAWAERIWCDGSGVHAAHAGGAIFHLQPANPEQPNATWNCEYQPWVWAGATGVDDYGLWADIQVEQLNYRLRWIPPGEFLMGSPAHEPGRFDNETQHRVRLTKGFWLGETSCPQTLWQAVMGENPSYHKGAELPVENVSWDDCQGFLGKLREMIPELPLALPSEAQWEYACRAGTQTAYWWGDEFDEQYANMGSETRREADYPANPFGLRSMSGNVYEWCADWFGDYPGELVADPAGPLRGQSRVLRGGGWIDGGRSLRSAYRGALRPVYRDDGYGLRLAGGFDPQASGRAVSADGRPWSGRRGGGQGPVADRNAEDSE